MKTTTPAEKWAVAALLIAIAVGYFTRWYFGAIVFVALAVMTGKSQTPEHSQSIGLNPSPTDDHLNTPTEQQRPSGKRATSTTEIDAVHAWPEPKNGDECDVVGEANYQTALRALAGDHGNHESMQQFTAHLIPEDDNPYDDKAVRVDIAGKTVGYFSRDDARSFRRRLGAKKLTGQTTTCGARITGGWLTKSGDRVSYGVRLLIKPFW